MERQEYIININSVNGPMKSWSVRKTMTVDQALDLMKMVNKYVESLTNLIKE